MTPDTVQTAPAMVSREIIEKLEQLEKSAAPVPWEWGVKGIWETLQRDARFICLLRNNARELIALARERLDHQDISGEHVETTGRWRP